MTFETYLIYVGTVLLFFAHPPGPSQLLFINGAMRLGTKRALPIMAGDLSANAVQIVIAGFGLASIIALSASAFTVLKWVGVGYLIWMGIKMIREARHISERQPMPSSGRLFRQGFITSAANPYAVIFFAALFPQFIDQTQSVAFQVAVLGATYLIIDGAILFAMGVSASRLVQLLGSRFRMWLSMISGCALVAAAVAIGLRNDVEASR